MTLRPALAIYCGSGSVATVDPRIQLRGETDVNCDNCGSELQRGLTHWHLVCATCGLEQSTLLAGDLADSDAVVNEAERESGLETLRKTGFAATFRILRTVQSPGALLDVGCAHGWFLDAGRDAGYETMGIEPSTRIAQKGISRGHKVLTGYFPEALQGRGKFDTVSFNDVFEHIPRASGTMRHAADILKRDGVLSIAIPTNRGFFYRLSKIFARVGVIGPFERLWQKQFSSPHLYYFNEQILTAMAAREGLDPVYRGTLPSVRLDGLWDRLMYDTSASRLKNIVIFSVVACAIPLLRFLPADIDLLMYKKRGDPLS
jgi:2-polyprenyl-3-methyl-5-hydroxy-6-metoxy-1,4-benzoquinol methylase